MKEIIINAPINFRKRGTPVLAFNNKEAYYFHSFSEAVRLGYARQVSGICKVLDGVYYEHNGYFWSRDFARYGLDEDGNKI